MKQIFSALLLLLLSNTTQAQATQLFSLSADDWAQPRSGKVIASFDSVRNAVDAWDKTYNAIIMIRYPGEDSGELWAIELRDWLVSLGIPNDYIILRAGLENLDEIKLVVGKQSEISE